MRMDAPLPSTAAQMALRAEMHLVARNAISLKTNASDPAQTDEQLGQSHCVATPPGSICIGTGLSALKHDRRIGNM
jgi:hypothetical protein